MGVCVCVSVFFFSLLFKCTFPLIIFTLQFCWVFIASKVSKPVFPANALRRMKYWHKMLPFQNTFYWSLAMGVMAATPLQERTEPKSLQRSNIFIIHLKINTSCSTTSINICDSSTIAAKEKNKCVKCIYISFIYIIYFFYIEFYIYVHIFSLNSVTTYKMPICTKAILPNRPGECFGS